MTDQPTKGRPPRPKRQQGGGSFEFIRGHWYVRVSMPDDTRPRYRLCKDECTCATMTEARREETGAAISERERARAKAEMARSSATLGPKVTMRKFGEQWTKGDLHKKWPDHVPLKETAKQDGQRLELHVYPHVESVAVADFRLEDAELVMSKLPAGLTSATRRHIAQLMHRLMALAVYPARIRQANPLPKGFMPRVKRVKAFSYPYPAEVAVLEEHKETLLVERIYFGFLAREGMREGEALGLDWPDVDLALGTVKLDVNKTDDPRTWKLGDDVAEALRRWWILTGSPKTGPVFRVGKERLDAGHLADRLRAALRAAGVTRPELFEHTKRRQQVRVHDLRSAFVTIALATGKSETWVADRTGHKSSVMINRYRRAARTAAELGLGWFKPMQDTIPELAELKNVRTLTAG